ncbi:MAG: coenzyme F420-0:L-glutamate ligase [bacterium]|nr:coenzyme F420-0:L-glutamate ligase [bacterium]
MRIKSVRTRIFKEREDLIAFITKHVPKLKDGFVLAVTSKIVALAEGRIAVVKDKKAKERLIRAESEWAVESYPNWWLTVKDGSFAINAGIDDSNADGKLVLLPKDSFRAAANIREKLRKCYGIKKLGIIITDSRVAPLRRGVFGTAIGYAGFRGLRDYRGTPDIFGRELEVTQVGVADSLAAAAALVMGEGRERQPLAVIEDAPVEFVSRVNRKELAIPFKDDIYRPLFSRKRR